MFSFQSNCALTSQSCAQWGKITDKQYCLMLPGWFYNRLEAQKGKNLPNHKLIEQVENFLSLSRAPLSYRWGNTGRKIMSNFTAKCGPILVKTQFSRLSYIAHCFWKNVLWTSLTALFHIGLLTSRIQKEAPKIWVEKTRVDIKSLLGNKGHCLY